jgi:hypothetical protein
MCVLLACLLLLPSALADAIDLSGMSDDDITGRVNRIKFPENRDFNLELYLRFSGNMSENQSFVSAPGPPKTPGSLIWPSLEACSSFELDGGDGLFGDELMGTGRISITRKVKKRGPRAALECAFT